MCGGMPLNHSSCSPVKQRLPTSEGSEGSDSDSSSRWRNLPLNPVASVNQPLSIGGRTECMLVLSALERCTLESHIRRGKPQIQSTDSVHGLPPPVPSNLVLRFSPSALSPQIHFPPVPSNLVLCFPSVPSNLALRRMSCTCCANGCMSPSELTTQS